MNREQPLVSIVTPVFNGSKYIEEMIKSVLDQDYPLVEHIIIDDGSNDNGLTVEILKKYHHLRWWSRPNKGAFATINEGLAACTGELVTVICADDKYASCTSLSAAVASWSNDSSADAVYGETVFIDDSGNELDRQAPQSVPVWLFRYYPAICHCSLLIDRAFIIKNQLFFDLRFPYMADYDWILRLRKAGCRFKRLRRPVAMFREHSAQRSRDTNPARIEERRLIMQLHGELNPVCSWVVQMWLQLTKLKNLFLRRGPRTTMQAVKQAIVPGSDG